MQREAITKVSQLVSVGAAMPPTESGTSTYILLHHATVSGEWHLRWPDYSMLKTNGEVSDSFSHLDV